MTAPKALLPRGTSRHHCGARTRPGAKYPTCHRPSGWGTKHPGQGRCKLHGGSSLVKHGRYSKLTHESVRDLAEHFEAIVDPLNILPELAQARALYTDYVNRYGEYTAALIAWHDSYRAGARPIGQDRVFHLAELLDDYEALLEGEGTERAKELLKYARETVNALGAPSEGKPMQVLDLADAYRQIEAISRIVKRIEDVRAVNAVSRADLLRYMGEMTRVVQLVVSDPEMQQRIRDGWLSIRL